MSAPGVSVRLVGGPAAVDGTVAPTTIAVEGLILLAVRGRRWCPLVELSQQCTDRASTEQLAASWILARYEIWGRPRRLRPQLYRHTATFALVAARDPRGRWTLQPGRRHETAVPGGRSGGDRRRGGRPRGHRVGPPGGRGGSGRPALRSGGRAVARRPAGRAGPGRGALGRCVRGRCRAVVRGGRHRGAGLGAGRTRRRGRVAGDAGSPRCWGPSTPPPASWCGCTWSWAIPSPRPSPSPCWPPPWPRSRPRPRTGFSRNAATRGRCATGATPTDRGR